MATSEDDKSPSNVVKGEEIDEDSLKFCTSCLESDGTQVDSIKFCSSCGDTLCKRCDDRHRRNKHTKDHPTIPIQEATIQQFQAARVVVDDHCQSHVDKPADMLCIDHQQLCCPICPATTHKSCTNFLDLEETAKIFISNKKTKAGGWDMKILMKEIEQLLKQEDATSTSLKNTTKDTTEQIEQFATALRQKIDTLEKKAKFELNKQIDKQNDRIEQNNLALEKLNEVLMKESRIYELFPHLTPRQVFISSKHMLDRLKLSYQSSKNRLKAIDILFKFQEADLANNFLTNITSLGEISKQPSESIPELSTFGEYLTSQTEALEIQQTTEAQVTLTSQKPTKSNPVKQYLLTAGLKLTRDVTRDDLKKGNVFFTSGTYLSDGYLVLCDYNNTRLLILDDNYTCVEEYNGLTGSPLGICGEQQGSDDVLYVSINNKTVEVIKYNKQGWTPTKTLSTDTGACGVACVGDTLITGRERKVVVQSLTGKTKKKEWRMRGSHSSVAVSPQGDRFYHGANNTVVCRGLDGTQYWKYQHEKLVLPVGMCTDHQGNVYVVGYSSCNIHQISSDGATHRIIVNYVHKMNPWGIVFHPHKNMFIVTSNDEDVALNEYTFC